MKLLLLILLLATPVAFTACGTPPSQRVATVQTLKAVGHTAESAVATAGQLYKGGVITEAQLREVVNLYQDKYLPAFQIAVLAAQSDIAVAPEQVVALAAQLSTLVINLQQKH